MGGTREQGLHANMRKGFDAVAESTRNAVPEEIDLLDEDYNEEEKVEHSLPAVEDGESWSRMVAIRVDKHILDQVEALEDKVASASMQVPGWRVPDRSLADTLVLRANCEKDAEGQDPVIVACQKLLELEAAIERRYLKAPLGRSNNNVTLEAINKDKDREKDNSFNNENGDEKHDEIVPLKDSDQSLSEEVMENDHNSTDK